MFDGDAAGEGGLRIDLYHAWLQSNLSARQWAHHPLGGDAADQIGFGGRLSGQSVGHDPPAESEDFAAVSLRRERWSRERFVTHPPSIRGVFHFLHFVTFARAVVRGYSQSKLGNALGISQATVSRMMAGRPKLAKDKSTKPEGDE